MKLTEEKKNLHIRNNLLCICEIPIYTLKVPIIWHKKSILC